MPIEKICKSILVCLYGTFGSIWNRYSNVRVFEEINKFSRLISSEEYDREKYLEMLLDSAEAVLSVFGFNRSLYGFDRKKAYHWWNEIYQQREKDIESGKSEL